MERVQLRRGLVVEEVDGALLVLDPSRSEVLELTGAQADAFGLAEAGTATDAVPEHLVAAMAGLVELGLVEAPGWSRRRVLLAGGAAAAATVLVLALPSPVAAQSTPGGGPGGGGPVLPTSADAPTLVGLTPNGRGAYLATFRLGNDNGFPDDLVTIFKNGIPHSTAFETDDTADVIGVSGDAITARVSGEDGENPSPFSNTVYIP